MGPGARARNSASGNGTPTQSTPTQGTATALPRLSKDVYRREHARIEGDLTRLNERRLVLEASLGDPAVQANFVELRRLGTELAKVEGAISLAEDAWLTLEERAPT
jgi:hypothetical protein